MRPPSAAPPYEFAPEERPLFPGSPYSPRHPTLRRVGYGLVAVLTALAATLGNALVTVNIPNLSGALGVYQVQASLLPAAYVAMNASANLLLIKARQQFGIPAVTHTLLVAYAAAGLLQFFVHGFGPALLMRAVSGMTAAGLTTMTIYNLLQTVPPAKRPLALVTGISLGQFGTPLARLFPVEMLTISNWQGLHLIEVGLALAALAALLALPLPPSDRSPAFERLDFVTIALVVPAMALLCGVLGVGRLVWWTDAPAIGVALAVAIPLFVAALVIEHNRARPLLQTKWIGTRDITRFVIVAVLVRLALAEQTYGSVGFLTSAGLTNDQLRTLFAWVLVAQALGLATTLILLTPQRIPYKLMAATVAIALGAWMDTHSTNVTRPHQLILSQCLIGYGTMLFIGPALAFGFLRMLEKGPGHLVTFIVLFSTTQNIGGLAGSALLGSYQVVATRAHTLALAERVLPSDPQALARLQNGARYSQTALAREASVLAFNDIFRLVMVIALLTLGYLVYIRTFNIIRQRRGLAQGAAMTDTATATAASPTPAAPDAPAPAPAPPPAWRPSRRRPWVIAVIVALTLAAILAILAAWGLPPFGGGEVATENAYVRGRTTVIAPQVSGYVTQVAMRDYQIVRQGQLLAVIDQRIYAARVAQARANVAAQLAQLANSTQAHASRAAGLQGQSAGLASAQAQLARARADMARADDLVKDGSISARERDQTLAALRAAEAQVRQAVATSEIARQDIRTVDVGRGGLEAQVEAARAQLRLAEIDLDNTLIRAPETGQIGEVGVRLGQYVTNGVQLVSLVPGDRWVIANFKEAQTRRVRSGQKAVLRVDALGGAAVRGHVEGLAPAAGSEFAVLKPDNATGNFVKAPQRIGVRITIDPGQPIAARLRPGMSVEARVDTRSRG